MRFAVAGKLVACARECPAHYKVLKLVDFIGALPRLPTGKLHKQGLRRAYLAQMDQTASAAGAARTGS
jgi:long-chain acyl-CoA synthetase